MDNCPNRPDPGELLAMRLERAKYLYRVDRGPEFIQAVVNVANWCDSSDAERLRQPTGSDRALLVSTMRFAARAWLALLEGAWEANDRGDDMTQGIRRGASRAVVEVRAHRGCSRGELGRSRAPGSPHHGVEKQAGWQDSRSIIRESRGGTARSRLGWNLRQSLSSE